MHFGKLVALFAAGMATAVTAMPLDASVEDASSPVEDTSSLVGPLLLPRKYGVLSHPNASDYSDAEVECVSKYRVGWLRFDIRGRHWSDEFLADNGYELHEKIRNCGAVTAWKYEVPYETEVGDWQWRATGRIPLRTRRCMANKLEKLGNIHFVTCRMPAAALGWNQPDH